MADDVDGATHGVEFVQLRGQKVELIRRGSGRPILFLHPAIGLDPQLPVLDRLAAHGELIAMSHPGFGASDRPSHMTSVEDIAYVYLDLMEQLDLQDVLVIGVSFGAWVAASVAIKSSDRITQLVLADPLGIKISARDQADIVDMFMLSREDFDACAYADTTNAPRNLPEKPKSVVRVMARNWESAARFGWLPYMHDPKLRHRLYRVKVPTLLLWGEQDRVISQDYVRAFGDYIPDTKFATIPGAGHYPHIEQPELFVSQILAFAEAGQEIGARSAAG